MANLGADFNASKPTEADFVRHPSKPNLATEIRFIRSRLKSFFGAVMDLDSGDFIKLMTAQLTQQDPTNPTDNNEMLAQMAQFSSLANTTSSSETLKSIATKLDSVVTAQNATADAVAKLAAAQNAAQTKTA